MDLLSVVRRLIESKNLGVPPHAGSAVPGFRAQGTPLLAQQPSAAPPLPNAGKLAGRGFTFLRAMISSIFSFP